MLNSVECPLQGAKCLECPFNKCELRAASNSQETLKCSSTQSYRYVRSFFLMAFFFLSLFFLTRSAWCHFHPCSLEVKTAMEMCLCAALSHLAFALTGTCWSAGAGLPCPRHRFTPRGMLSCNGSQSRVGKLCSPHKRIWSLEERGQKSRAPSALPRAPVTNTELLPAQAEGADFLLHPPISARERHF